MGKRKNSRSYASSDVVKSQDAASKSGKVADSKSITQSDKSTAGKKGASATNSRADKADSGMDSRTGKT